MRDDEAAKDVHRGQRHGDEAEQRAPLKSLIDTLAEYDGTAAEYTALMVLVQEQMERIEYEQARKQRNRRIAMAMLMAS